MLGFERDCAVGNGNGEVVFVEPLLQQDASTNPSDMKDLHSMGTHGDDSELYSNCPVSVINGH